MILATDVGTSGVRVVVVDHRGGVVYEDSRALVARSPLPGRYDFDPSAQAAAVLEMSTAAIGVVGPVAGVAVTNQRASTVCWERATGRPIGSGIGWQDDRATPQAIELAKVGYFVAAGSTGPTAAWHVAQSGRRASDLCVGTVDSWIVWHLTEGAAFVSDPTNMSGGLVWSPEHGDVHPTVLDALGLPRSLFPSVVDTAGHLGFASALPGSPPILAIVGDQMASLAGHGDTKVTFGTGAMLDVAVGDRRPAGFPLTPHGCVSFVASRVGSSTEWMIEAAMLAAGSNVNWLRDGLSLIDGPSDLDALAGEPSGPGKVTYVPALAGLGTPHWDASARGTLFGLDASTTRGQVARAVLEGVAQATADLVEAAEVDSRHPITSLSVDGGMAANTAFVQLVADAISRPVDVAHAIEMTALGAALMAGMAIGMWSGREDLAEAWRPTRRVEPVGAFDRDRWREACRRATDLARPL